MDFGSFELEDESVGLLASDAVIVGEGSSVALDDIESLVSFLIFTVFIDSIADFGFDVVGVIQDFIFSFR